MIHEMTLLEFRNSDDLLEREIAVGPLSESQLQENLGLYSDTGYVDMYEVDVSRADNLRAIASVQLDFQKYAYFLTRYSEE